MYLCPTGRTTGRSIVKEWVFTVELALRSNDISEGACQVDFVSTLLEGNALLWLIADQNAGKSFGDWQSLKSAIAETFGPIQNEEENRLALFSLYQRRVHTRFHSSESACNRSG